MQMRHGVHSVWCLCVVYVSCVLHEVTFVTHTRIHTCQVSEHNDRRRHTALYILKGRAKMNCYN